MHAIIPARSGSKRLKDKNIKPLGNHPLIAFSIEACIQSKRIDRVFVSTDCPNIAKIAESYGAEIPFLRPSEISGGDSSDDEFLSHFFSCVDCDEIALIRPTSPLRDPDFLDECVDEFLGKCDDSFTGFRTMAISAQSPYKMYQLSDDHVCSGFFSDFKGVKTYTNLPTHLFPSAYNPNGYLDVVKRAFLKKDCTFGDRIYGKVSPHITDIDNEFDFYLAELQLNTRLDKLSVFLNNKKV